MTNANDLTASAQEFLGSDDFKKLLPYLLSGGAGAAGAAWLTGRRKKKQGEGRLGYLGRILGNAAMGGGLAAGGHYLLNKGLEKTVGGEGGLLEDLSSGPQEGPLEAGVRETLTNPATAALAGLGGLSLTSKWKGLGVPEEPKAHATAQLRKILGLDKSFMGSRNPRQMGDIIGTLPKELQGEANRLRRMAGIASEGPRPANPSRWANLRRTGRGAASVLMRNGVAPLIGNNSLTRVKRLTVGGVSAGLPALLAALTTRPSPELQ